MLRTSGQLKHVYPIVLPAYGQRHYIFIMAANIRGIVFSQWKILKEILNQVPCLLLTRTLGPSTESYNIYYQLMFTVDEVTIEWNGIRNSDHRIMLRSQLACHVVAHGIDLNIW